jgi:GMP synthase-like glutamine amidotransferase
MRTLTIGILETGIPPEGYKEIYGSYPDMFRDLLSASDTQLAFNYYPILDGNIPTDPASCDAWLITGSKFGVYEDHPWIEPLSNLVRNAFDADIPVVGICFGHQLVVQALGGKVVKSDKGWSLGVSEYQIKQKPQWIESANDTFAIQAYHQDQVVTLPQNTQVLAGSDFCPYAALNIADKVITFQGHPEFSSTYIKALLVNRRDLGLLPAELSNEAIDKIETPNQRHQVADWICQFIRSKLA